jgi:hypothetical protein
VVDPRNFSGLAIILVMSHSDGCLARRASECEGCKSERVAASQAMQIGRRRPKIITLGWLGQGQVPALSSLPPTTTILPLSSQSGPVPPSKPNMSTTTLSDEAETSDDDVSIDGSGILRSAPYLDSPLLSGLFQPYAVDKRCVWVEWAADAPPRPFNTGSSPPFPRPPS